MTSLVKTYIHARVNSDQTVKQSAKTGLYIRRNHCVLHSNSFTLLSFVEMGVVRLNIIQTYVEYEN